MYTSIALISSVAALALSNPLPAAPRRHRIQAQNLNLNPNMGDQKIVDGSLGSKYRPDLSDSEYIDFKNPNNAKKGAIRNGQAQHDIEAAAEGVNVDDVPNQNQIMNEISNIIQQNNIRVRKLKVAPAAVNEQEPLDLAVPIVNEQDPNNGEQFEKLPRVNERIPVVNGIANDNEGIVYNEPKVHERVPINKQVDLEDTRNIDAVINKLAQHMNDNKMSENKMAAKNLIHHDHHHHLHRGADMGDKEKTKEEEREQMQQRKDNKMQLKQKNVQLDNLKEERLERRQKMNGLNRRNHLQNQPNRRQLNLNRYMRQMPCNNRRQLAYMATLNQRNKNLKLQENNENIHKDTLNNRILAIENMERKNLQAKQNKERIDNRIRALEDEILLAQHKLPLKEALKVAPQVVKLDDLVDVNNVKDVISALDDDLPKPVPEIFRPDFQIAQVPREQYAPIMNRHNEKI